MPLELATHSVEYVCPSHPQTGRYSRVQMFGIGVQIPGASAAPQRSPIVRRQNSPVAHAGPSPAIIPPQLRALLETGVDVKSGGGKCG